jgi:hypothetical protein
MGVGKQYPTRAGLGHCWCAHQVNSIVLKLEDFGEARIEIGNASHSLPFWLRNQSSPSTLVWVAESG